MKRASPRGILPTANPTERASSGASSKETNAERSAAWDKWMTEATARHAAESAEQWAKRGTEAERPALGILERPGAIVACLVMVAVVIALTIARPTPAPLPARRPPNEAPAFAISTSPMTPSYTPSFSKKIARLLRGLF